jgi:predicted Fe-Mo cluster-binding NifX family protein
MRIAVTYDPQTGEIFQHFGRTQYFKVYDIEDDQIVDSSVQSTNGLGHGALVTILSNLEADALICGGIGPGAQNALNASGIHLFGGCAGLADQAMNDYLEGHLNYQAEIKCDHHDHHHEGGCEGHCHH